MGMKRWTWLLLMPYVVGSSYTVYCEPKEWSYEVRESSVCIMDQKVGRYPLEVAKDLAEALNEAHERRIQNSPVYCQDGLYQWPCQESK